MIVDFPTDIHAIAAAIDIPVRDWPRNCHAVATAVLRRLPTEGMRLVRGHFDGHVDRDSVYGNGGLQQHSWLRLQDGRILDPTRWAMTRPAGPFLYVGENDHYDEAGMVARQRYAPMRFMNLGADHSGPARAILDKLLAAPPSLREDLAAFSHTKNVHEPDIRFAEAVLGLIDRPVEQLRDPERLYALLEQAGLKAFVKLDNWTRVMEPEQVMPDRGANFLYRNPPGEAMTEMQKLFKVFSRFLSIEERELRIEDELDEYGYSLDDLHDALNRMERMLRIDPELTWLDSGARDLLCVVGSDLLGKGYGEELRVERYADSIGLDRQGLHRAIVRFAEPAGFDFVWLMPDEVESLDNSPAPM